MSRFQLSQRLSIITLSLAFIFSSQAEVIQKQEDREPEAATGVMQKQAVTAKEFMIAAANPYASEAGFNILKKGGSAIDAAIAVQLVLTLVEPQSSGIGGGAFILHWDKSKKFLTTFDVEKQRQKRQRLIYFLMKRVTPYLG